MAMRLGLMLLLLGMVLLESNAQPESCGDAEASTGFKTAAALNVAASTGAGPFTICPNTTLDDEMLRPMIDGTIFMCATTSCVLNKGVVMDADGIRVSLVGITFADFDEPVISGSAGSNSTLELRQTIFQVRIP